MSGFNDQDPSLNTDAPLPNPLEQSLDQSDVGLPPEPEPPAVYKALPGSRVPVSSKRGLIWKARKDQGQKAMTDLTDAWDEAIRYYNHDQSDHRDGSSGSGVAGSRSPRAAGNRSVAKRLNDTFSSTENIVFSNVTAQVPELYAKNPVVSVSATPTLSKQIDETVDAFARALQKLINVLFALKTSPGVNIKPKAKRNVLIALLTNQAWFEVGFTKKDTSSEQAMQDLLALSQQLAEAEEVDDIRAIEGQLQALEEKIEFLQPSGPFVRIRLPHQIIRDPNGSDPYLNDSNWLLVEDLLPTAYINAIYANVDPDSDEAVSIFEPTHILNSGGDSSDSDEFSLFQKNDSYSQYGYDDKAQFDKACYTKVWWVWDKTTRRLEMYADNDWKWPIWVWDDPYQLQGFFPFTPMWFHDNPVSVYAKGEVSYYLDQQDQINEINDEKRRALLWARRNIFYNKNVGITQETIDRVLQGPTQSATPLDVPEGVDPSKMIFSLLPPSMNFTQLFVKDDLYKAVDRIASTSEVERGGEFKTNTTNKAIDYYSTMGNMRMDMRLDAIEDALGDVGWKLAQLCLRFMDVQTASQLTGMDVSPFWRPLDNLRDFQQLSVGIVGGSTQKLTTQQKKQEAIQIGQVLSQYVRAAPASALKVTLDMMSKAFDDFMISKEDWDSIEAEVATMAQSQRGGAPGQGSSSGEPATPPVGGTGGQPMPAAAAGGGMQVAAQVVQALQQLPPPVLQAIGNALAQGIPPTEIFRTMLASQGGSNQGAVGQ